MHSPDDSIFALYRTQTPNRGNSRGKGLAFVTSEIRDSEGHILLIRRQCIGYVAYSPLWTYRRYERKKPDTSGDASGGRYRAKKYPIRRLPYRACNERRVLTYSVAGVLDKAPSIPAMVMVTSPMNIEPND